MQYLATLEKVGEIRHRVRKEAFEATVDISTVTVDNISIATGEITTNVVKHCDGPVSDGILVEIWFTVEEEDIKEHIRAQSHCAHSALIECALECDPIEKALESVSQGRESGLGLAIIGALAKEHSMTEDGELVLTFALH